MAKSPDKSASKEKNGTVTKKQKTGRSLSQDMELHQLYMSGKLTYSEYQSRQMGQCQTA